VISTDRITAITRLYTSGASLREVGGVYGISGERVRQLLVEYERQTGEIVTRHSTADSQFKRRRGRPQVERIVWRCSDCGLERRVRASQIRTKKRCARCYRNYLGSRISADVIQQTIAAILSGRSNFYREALAIGFTKRSSHRLTASVYIYLRHRARDDTLAALWPGGVPGWLLKRYPS
jgi:hypothetical protein